MVYNHPRVCVCLFWRGGSNLPLYTIRFSDLKGIWVVTITPYLVLRPFLSTQQWHILHWPVPSHLLSSLNCKSIRRRKDGSGLFLPSSSLPWSPLLRIPKFHPDSLDYCHWPQKMTRKESRTSSTLFFHKGIYYGLNTIGFTRCLFVTLSSVRLSKYMYTETIIHM